MKKSDIKVEHIKGGGPGGQHRNKRQTGVRVTHNPTGTIVVATERRSQIENLHNALARLQRRLALQRRRPKLRTETEPSKASQRKRLEQKKRRQQIKKSRARPTEDGG